MQEPQRDAMQGVEMTGDGNEPQDLLLTEEEKRILSVFDRLENLQFEIALLKAQGILSQDTDPISVSTSDIEAAQNDLLSAKAAYTVRSNVIENVLIANPIIKAVHSGNKASAAEQDLLPLIQKRDELSIKHTQLSASLLSARNSLTELQAKNVVIAKRNRELTKQMLELASEANTQRKDVIGKRERDQLEELELAMGVSRQRWRIMKGTAAGVVVGSGVDWAGDEGLRAIVLDEEG